MEIRKRLYIWRIVELAAGAGGIVLGVGRLQEVFYDLRLYQSEYRQTDCGKSEV